jgi:dynein heavy chain, axonemal
MSDTVDPGLDPVLTKACYLEDGVTKLNLGDKALIYEKNFNLLMTTKLQNPHYMPEVCIKLTVINFTVTFLGLEEQMLVDVINN